MMPLQERVVRRMAGQTDHDQVVSWRWSGRSFRFTVPGDNVWICVKDDLLLREYEWMGTRLDQATGVVVDAGAHVGTFSALAAVHAERVVALEPNPDTVGLLRRNLAENHLDNVVVHPMALWADESGRVLDSSVATSSATIAGEAEVGPRVATTTIDALVAETGPIDVLKMDIEGSEFVALDAASDASLAQVREVVGELHLAHAQSDDLPRLVSRLERVGFAVEVRRLPIFHTRQSLRRLRKHWGSLDGQLRLKVTLALVYLAAGALDPVTGARRRLAGHDLRLFRAWRPGGA